MALGEPVTEHLSVAEVTDAIRALSPTDLARLRAIARVFTRFSALDADELTQEAVHRAMAGKRPCPRHVKIVPFVAQVMRSIASDAAKSRKRHPEVQLESLTVAGKEPPSDCMNAEELLVAAEDEKALIERAAATRHTILELCSSDPVARDIAEGIMDGLEGEELRALTELDKKAFASKRKLIRRWINKAFPGSTKS
jgi:RNA polymerase sigma-70 factor (ECF subfamily)